MINDVKLSYYRLVTYIIHSIIISNAGDTSACTLLLYNFALQMLPFQLISHRHKTTDVRIILIYYSQIDTITSRLKDTNGSNEYMCICLVKICGIIFNWNVYISHHKHIFSGADQWLLFYKWYIYITFITMTLNLIYASMLFVKLHNSAFEWVFLCLNPYLYLVCSCTNNYDWGFQLFFDWLFWYSNSRVCKAVHIVYPKIDVFCI